MKKETKNGGRLEGGRCEQFAYFTSLTVYPNTLGIKELCEIAGEVDKYGNFY